MLIPKKNYIRDKNWRKFLSQKPCLKCGAVGKSQAAHLTSGGRGIKSGDDNCISLCTIKTNGELGCHEKLDQHLEKEYWNSRLDKCAQEMRKAYNLWKMGEINLCEIKLIKVRNEILSKP